MLIIIWDFCESIFFAAEGVNIARVIKMWHTDMKWANGVGKMEPKHLLEARLTNTNLQFGQEKGKRKKKRKAVPVNAIKQSATEWSVPLTVKGSSPSQVLSLNYAAHHVRTWSLVTISAASSSLPCTQLIILPTEGLTFSQGPPLPCIREFTFDCCHVTISSTWQLPLDSVTLWPVARSLSQLSKY